MALSLAAHRSSDQPGPFVETPPRGGWYWNDCRLVRAWLPVIGLDGLGLLDLYLALADHRPGSAHPGWSAITLSELTRLSGWGRARLIRLNRRLVAAGLLTIRHEPVAGRGPAVQRALYRVVRTAGLPNAASRDRLDELANEDPALASRRRRWSDDDSATTTATAAPLGESHRPVGRTAPGVGSTLVRPATSEAPQEPGPVPAENRSVEESQTKTTTTTATPARIALERWQDANGHAASCLERQRLAQLAAAVEVSAQAAGASGWQWVAAAIDEAVEAGSHYVAPRRVARILERWQVEGRPDRTQAPRPPADRRPPPSPGRARPHHRGETPPKARQTLRAAGPPRPTAETSPLPPAVTVEATEQPALAAAAPARPTVTAQPLRDAPAAPAAMLQSALALAGLTAEVYLRGAVLLGQMADGTLLVATPVPLPPVIAARLAPRLARGLGAFLGRSVHCRLIERPGPASGAARACMASVGV